ncbi:RICIN domain-containing protein [Streptomyces sp. NPDC005799]|uniref:RICIN domain-containing protein n=1 Tax=Streptomyces sp. NPDC005799 TaxID=3154678 RepID=UPI0033DA736C
MARAGGTDKDVETGELAHTGASDARLTELLRADTASAFQALQELRARHRPRVLRYARLCTTSESAARQLAAQAFTLAARETARGIDPGGPWRHQLLLLTSRLAAAWAMDDRAGGLDAGLLLVLNTAGPGGPVPPMLAAFQSLPSRTQGLVWYRVVEEQPAAATAEFLGVTPEDVAYGTDPALQQLAQTCLRARLAASDDPQCADFRRLIEESVRPDSPRDSADLHAHMAHCAHCTTAHEELSALRDSPRSALAEGLLPWAGTAYATDEDAPRRPGSRAASPPWPRSRRYLLASAALGVALAPLLVFLLTRGSPSAPARQSAGAGGTPTTAPQVTVTATVSTTPSASASPSAKSPSPTKSSAPPASPRPTSSPAHAPNGTYAQVVNVSTGRCLDILDGELSNGTDVVTAPCTGSATQRWRVDTARGVVQSYADSGFCLDSRGDVDKGVGIWECDSLDGDHGDNLRFTVDSDGVIRPAIAIETGLTPAGGDGVSLAPLNGGAGQRWRAGAS